MNQVTTQEIMGLRIKKLREELKMSQTALAEKVGYKDKTAIAKIEAGKVDLPQSKISAFVKALNTTTSYLFGDTSVSTESKPNTVNFDGEEYTEEELEEIRQFAAFVRNKRK